MIKEVAHFQLASVVIVNNAISMHKTQDYAERDSNSGMAFIHPLEVDDFIKAVQEAKRIIEATTAP